MELAMCLLEAGFAEGKPLAECVDMGQWLAGLEPSQVPISLSFKATTWLFRLNKSKLRTR